MKLSSVLLTLLLALLYGCAPMKVEAQYPEGAFVTFIDRRVLLCEKGAIDQGNTVMCDHGVFWQIFEGYQIVAIRKL